MVGISKTEVGHSIALLVGELAALGVCQPDGTLATSLADLRDRLVEMAATSAAVCINGLATRVQRPRSWANQKVLEELGAGRAARSGPVPAAPAGAVWLQPQRAPQAARLGQPPARHRLLVSRPRAEPAWQPHPPRPGPAGPGGSPRPPPPTGGRRDLCGPGRPSLTSPSLGKRLRRRRLPGASIAVHDHPRRLRPCPPRRLSSSATTRSTRSTVDAAQPDGRGPGGGHRVAVPSWRRLRGDGVPCSTKCFRSSSR
jgi:hypothetical protein